MDPVKRKERYWHIKRLAGYSDEQIQEMWDRNTFYDDKKSDYNRKYRTSNVTPVKKRKATKRELDKWKRIQAECKELKISYGQYQVMKANGTYPGKE